jgi:hypothetical protein
MSALRLMVRRELVEKLPNIEEVDQLYDAHPLHNASRGEDHSQVRQDGAQNTCSS